jgi:hypothetical protein
MPPPQPEGEGCLDEGRKRMSGGGRLDGRDQAVGGCLTIVFIAFAVFALAHGCSRDSSGSGFTYPSDVLDHKISVVDGGSELDVTLEIPEPDHTSPGEVWVAGLDILHIVKHEVQVNGTESAIVFHLVENTGGGYDQYG